MKADKYIKPEIEIIEMESEVIATSPTDLGTRSLPIPEPPIQDVVKDFGKMKNKNYYK